MADRIDVDGGKYTVVSDAGHLTALRYGQPWRELTGDNLVFHLAMELQEARGELARLKQPGSRISLNITQADADSIIAAAQEMGAGPGMDHPHRGDLAHYQSRMGNHQKALAHMLAETYVQKFDWSDVITAVIDHVHNSAIEQALQVVPNAVAGAVRALKVIPTHE